MCFWVPLIIAQNPRDFGALYMGVQKLATVPYRPSSNGITERENGIIKAMLSAFVNKRADDWDEHLDAVMMAYRSSVHKTLNETPS